MIITDYRTIPKSIEVCIAAGQKFTQKVSYLIVDNSNRHDGIKYLKNQKIAYKEDMALGKNIYFFGKDGCEFALIDADGNGGYAIGNNLGAKLAKQIYGSDIYLFSNNDVEFPQKISCERVESIFKNNQNIGIVGPDIKYKGNEKQNPRRFRTIWSQEIFWNFNALWFHCRFNRFLNNLEISSERGCVDWVVGCFIFVSAKAFDKVDGFDENTFLYAEEMIISKKMLKYGYITYYEPDIKLNHNHQGVDNRKMRKILHKSKMYYYKKYCRNNIMELWLASLSFYITELGYFLYHDILKNQILKKGSI